MEISGARMASNRLATIARHVSPTPSSLSFMSVRAELHTGAAIRIGADVRDALENHRPVVALESTIISHGMPFPQNFETAKEVEAIVRQSGASPATIAILDGVPCIGTNLLSPGSHVWWPLLVFRGWVIYMHSLFIQWWICRVLWVVAFRFAFECEQLSRIITSAGLTGSELEELARLGSKAQKTARRDIAHVIAQKATGATTVSATMFFAAKVGISVFVTGGIGGVHREGETTMDVSSDLTELGRTAVTVVCAGVKSILDIPRTLEYLETQGVTVIGYNTDEFPAFFTPRSGCKAPSRADTPEECAAISEANLKMGLQSGILVAVPIPAQHAALASSVEAAIQKSLSEVKERNVSGAAVTPYVLRRVNELTGGASLAANIELIKNNARVGSRIAVALASH